MKSIFSIFVFLLASISYGQLDFCNGSKGDPIFFEDFGSGTDFGPALAAGLTSYTFVSRTPNDGQYSLYYQLNLNGTWHNSPDHTPDSAPNGVNGKALIVNADFRSGEFYRRTVNGLCVNTNFEFSAWLMNIYDAASNGCSGTGIPVDVTFEIWDATETTLLRSGSTGAIDGTTSAIWKQFGLTFTTLPGQTSVVLKMKNNGAGGCGNDLAIDDIAFRSCGDPATIVSSLSSSAIFESCIDNVPATLPLNISITNSNPHVFQWQQSLDATNWTDIPGQTSNAYNLSNPSRSQYIRVKIAQDISNLSNPFCFTVSDYYHIVIYQKPAAPTSRGHVQACGDETPELLVTLVSGNTVNWYDAPVGGNLLQANSVSFSPDIAGDYYAEASILNLSCVSSARTLVTLTIFPVPEVEDEETFICENLTKDLNAGVASALYEWTPGNETSKIITISDPGIYSVKITNSGNCSAVKTFTVTEGKIPTITSIDTTDGIVTINIAQSGKYEFSLDGTYYQDSNVFAYEKGGLKKAYVREKNGCGFDSENFLLVITPKYFTPNNDGYNDTFEIAGLEYMPDTTLYIFNKFGKLLKTGLGWDGTFNGKLMPADDYWYRITTKNGTESIGHFSLKR